MSIMGKETNLNTILLAIAIGVLGWLAFETNDTGKKVSALTEKDSAIADKMAAIDRELIDLRTRLAKVEIDFAAYQARNFK